MSRPHMDNNDLARLLDGTLSEEERVSTVAHLSKSDADAEVLADAAYLLREPEAEDGMAEDEGVPAGHPHDDGAARTAPGVVPLRPPSTARTWRRAPARWLALAAMVAGVLLVPLALSRSGSREPGDFASLLASRGDTLPSGWVERNRWSRTRSAGDPVTETARAARLGALQVALEVAAAAGQVEETGLLSDRIVALLANVSGSAAVAAAYRDIAARVGTPGESLATPLAEARESLAMFVDEDEDHFTLGAWAEAAGLAARRRDAAFFHDRASRKLLDRAASLPSLDGDARSSIEKIRAQLRSGGQPDWSVLEVEAAGLLSSLAS